MVSSPSYRRLGTSGNDGLLFRYKLAKALTVVSLIAIVLMAVGSLVYSQSPVHQEADIADSQQQQENSSEKAPPSTPNKAEDIDVFDQDDTCQLPEALYIPKSEDGTYTPPGPDPTLLKALRGASADDLDYYCRNVYDPVHGFTDVFPYNVNGECGTWQQEFTASQNEKLKQLERMKAGEVLAPEEVPRFASYLCKEVPENGNRGCGGLADRMSGMISTFFFALLTDRGYLAHWADENPIPLEILFEKPNIDWSYDPREMSRLYNKPKLGITYQKVDTLNQKYDDFGKVLYPDGPDQDFNNLWNGTYVEIRSNRAYIIRTFQVSTRYPAILESKGLTMQNAFGCFADYLFRPTIGSRRFINAYKQLFQMDSILSIGLQIRTDDNALANPQKDTNDLKKWDYFLTCANQIASVKRQPHHKRIVYFMITDSVRLRDEFASLNERPDIAEKYFGDYYLDTTAVVTGLPVEHIEPDQIEKYIDVEIPVEVTRERMTPGANSAMIENWLLSYTDYRVISPQGYGKLAAFHSRSDNTTYSLPRVNRKDKAPDCSKPSAIATYDWLSHQWSLG